MAYASIICSAMALVFLSLLYFSLKSKVIEERKPERYCVECKYYEEFKRINLEPARWCKKGIRYDIVTGAPVRKFCIIERGEVGPCGPEGKLFEPKGE